MKCGDRGQLRAYIDGELPESLLKVERHLVSCPACRAQLDQVRGTAEWVAEQTAVLEPSLVMNDDSAALALSRWKERKATMTINTEKRTLMQFVSRWWRPATIGVAAALCLGFVISPPGRSMAADFLSVFRVQKVTTVVVSPSDVPNIPGLSDLSAFGSLQMPQRVNTQPVDRVDEASQKVGFPVRLPTVLPSDFAGSAPKLMVQEEINLSYTFDLTKTKKALESAGLVGIQLPAGLDGATVQGTIPPSAIATYGGGEKALIVGQAKSPVLELPPGVDFDSLRLQFLQAYGKYSPQLASQLLSIQDWKSTLVIPVPKEGVRKEVSVDGVQGALIESPPGQRQDSVVMWQKDGIVYGVAGGYSGAELLKVANSLR